MSFRCKPTSVYTLLINPTAPGGYVACIMTTASSKTVLSRQTTSHLFPLKIKRLSPNRLLDRLPQAPQPLHQNLQLRNLPHQQRNLLAPTLTGCVNGRMLQVPLKLKRSSSSMQKAKYTSTKQTA
ncbi:hypothetical protein DSO57_1011019 [Entomophthora muscae]|uniref:Uncharacterized protein n=1 Tax=Entomophthora muscae TaxID=34485 RepID=A0ACC2S8A4_9FUNG|nr:hypothetical protein DSO57_1011019 [Entomophthora muscae]